jgi:hypothetical protein
VQLIQGVSAGQLTLVDSDTAAHWGTSLLLRQATARIINFSLIRINSVIHFLKITQGLLNSRITDCSTLPSLSGLSCSASTSDFPSCRAARRDTSLSFLIFSPVQTAYGRLSGARAAWIALIKMPPFSIRPLVPGVVPRLFLRLAYGSRSYLALYRAFEHQPKSFAISYCYSEIRVQLQHLPRFRKSRSPYAY